MKPYIKLSVVIVNYNVQDFLLHALQSLKKALRQIPHEIIVVDNASADNSVSMLRRRFPEVILIANERNVGFSAANNQGLQQAKGEYLLLINPDTLVQEDTLTKLVEFMDNTRDAGAATCKILNPDGSFSIDCRHSIPTPMTAFWKLIGFARLFPKSKVFARYNLTYLDPDETYAVDAISCSFMLIRREAFEQVGMMDADYFMYCEDVDYCYRINQHGWKLYYVPQSSIIHYKGESTKKNNIDYVINFNKSLYLFYKKHFHSRYFSAFRWIILLGVFLRGVIVYGKNFLTASWTTLLDLLLLNLVILVTFVIRFEMKSGFYWQDFFGSYIVINGLASLIFLGVAFFQEMYERYRFSISRILRVNFTTFFILAAMTFFLKQFAFSRLVVVIAAVASIMVMTGWRVLLRAMGKTQSSSPGHDLFRKRTLLVGSDDATAELAQKIIHSVNSSFDLVGLVSTDPAPAGRRIAEVPVVGDLQRLGELVRLEKIDQVIFSTHDISYEEILTTMSRLNSARVEFKVIPENLEVIIGKSSVERIDDYPLVEIDYAIGRVFNRFSKRLFDLAAAAVLLLLLLPVWLWLLPVKWRSTKVREIWGERGEPVALRQSPKGFLNGILSLIAVLRGRLSLVGAPLRSTDEPRPKYFYRPGITGLRQINTIPGRAETDLEKFELFYLKNQSLWLDVEILFKALRRG